MTSDIASYEFFEQMKLFLNSLFNVLSLFFDLFFNRLNIFGVGVGWWFVILTVIGAFGSIILGVFTDD